MGVIDGLLVNKGFIIKSLLSLIEEERDRLVESGLIRKASCDNYLGNFIKKLSEDTTNVNTDEIISKLTNLYDSMQNVKLYGDKFFEEESKINTNSTSISPVNVPMVSEKTIAANINTLVIDGLEKIAYSLGSVGNHVLAFEVEKVIKNIKDIGE